ncbi:hypothetical protein C8R45DRAFT_1137090 [Mycena sanguinolenta]|nr:hypothetical protein C8R45DRAFT_1137090 [Mycena sanguinolenta]
MDQKLYMPEILDIVFAFLAPVNGFSHASQTLAALARTCKAFQDPALNALWALQTSLVPAFWCFPHELWDRSSNPESLSFVGFSRPLVPTDWELVFRPPCAKYSEFVVRPNTFSQIFEQSLGWTGIPLIFLFLESSSPLVSTPSAYTLESTMELSLLHAVGIKCPNLTELNLRAIHAHGPLLLRAVSVLLSNLKHLESLSIRRVDAAILDHIAYHSSLKFLEVDEAWQIEFRSNSEVANSQFRSLELLSLWSTTPDVGTSIIGAIQHRGLREIDLIFESEFPDRQTTARLYAAIDANGSHRALTSLRIEDEVGTMRPEASIPPKFVQGETLAILFPFANLTTIVLKPCHGFDVDDTTIARMARSWTHVQELRLAFSHDSHSDHTTRTTLAGIHSIALHCLKLHTLELYFDATTIPAIEKMTTQTNLVGLEVLCSPIISPKAVAKFLSEVFPQLLTLDSKCDDLEDENPIIRLWRRVSERIVDRLGNAH